MKSMPCHAGHARRSETYQQLETSSRDARAPGVTTAAVTGLIARAVKVLCPSLPPAAVHLLILLVEHVHGDDKWRQGRLRVIPSNARLAMMLGTCERRVRSLLALLEANHWIIRRYTEANRRNRPEAGIDLAPVAARLADLRRAADWVAEEGREARRRSDAERDDADVSRSDESSREDRSDRLKSYSVNPEPTAPVQPASDPGELVSLMLHASPRLQAAIAPQDLVDLLSPRPPGPALHRLAAAVGFFVREMGLSTSAWTDGVRRHEWAALAAAAVAMERQGVERRPGYLRAMLRHPNLQSTVRHSLRRLIGGH
ncbi:MAG: helix-turn-helix domain-containing protein [Rhodospirillaceae bacterium]